MRVCMVSPHLPPEQSANALLPAMLGDALASRGVVTTYVSHPTDCRIDRDSSTGASTYVPEARARSIQPLARRRRCRRNAHGTGSKPLDSRERSRSSSRQRLHHRDWRSGSPRRYRKPYVITLYGTDISAYDPRRNARFGRVVREAACRVFYSRGLLEQAQRCGLATNPSTGDLRAGAPGFAPVDERERLQPSARSSASATSRSC